MTPRTRPRVLLVDDHRGMLDTVAALLGKDVDVAGTATDGHQAVAMAADLAPDAIVLDINMPGLDGFETKSALDNAGSQTPVVFLSMMDADDYIGEAFRRGGRGYVLKANVARDLPGALHHVLHGRRFVPSLTALFHVAADNCHAMQLYRDPASFISGLTGFLDLALRRGDALCVMATDDVRDGVKERLHARGWKGGAGSPHPRVMIIDAKDALGRVMRNGRPEPAHVAEIASELDQYRVAAGGPAARLTVCGNMVNVLTAGGNPAGAIALERLWNSLTHSLPFITLCGYSSACFHDVGGQRSEACTEHCTVSHADSV